MKTLLLLAFAFLFSTSNAQTLVGRTTGRLPYLNFGLGEDRLGGAKMTYLDSNVLVQVVDSTKDNYKVKLSQSHHAFLPKIISGTTRRLPSNRFISPGAGASGAMNIMIISRSLYPKKSLTAVCNKSRLAVLSWTCSAPHPTPIGSPI